MNDIEHSHGLRGLLVIQKLAVIGVRKSVVCKLLYVKNRSDLKKRELRD